MLSLPRLSRVAALVLVVGMTGCEQGIPGSGVAATEARALDAFHRLWLVGHGRAEVTIGSPASCEITADDNLLPLIGTTVVNGQLTVKPREPIAPVTELVLRIRVPKLDAVMVTGVADVDVGELAAEAFAVEAAGVGSVKARGRTDRLSIRITGSGEVEALDLLARAVEVEVDGAADVEVHATETLRVAAAGAGEVRYRGDPVVTKQLSGVADVTKIE